MPSFFNKKKGKANHEEEDENAAQTQQSLQASSSKSKGKKSDVGSSSERSPTPPPSYQKAGLGNISDAPPPFEAATASAQGSSSGDQLTALVASFTHLKLETQKDPDVDTCIAHLRLIHAIQTLKEEIGYSNGLWDLWDARAGPVGDLETGELDHAQVADLKTKLSHLREKRWAVYVARAVDRYRIWWQAIAADQLLEKEVHDSESPRWIEFPKGATNYNWTEDRLPPLDVLMVWHTHMLNPRNYLEDSMRWGLRDLWTTGMPWAIVNKVLDSKMHYSPSSECRINWETLKGIKWGNEDDPMVRIVNCPACKQPNQIAWTTCGLPETYKGIADPGLTGNGFGDGNFTQPCIDCAVPITKSLLSVQKLVEDTRNYIENGVTMPGSVLHPESGMPPNPGQIAETIFPNHLARQTLGAELENLISPSKEIPNMLFVKELFSKTLLAGQGVSASRETDPESTTPIITQNPLTQRQQGVQVRKMMARYWDNHSIFALDLVAAVMRQGVFIEKMVRLNWLVLPIIRQSMDRFCQKYQRFLLIMLEDSMSLCVPTLDIDLIWHTHQLAPRAYYHFTTTHSAKMALHKAKFVDHNDKVEESTLSRAFEKTSATYLAKFGEVYTECTCGYCEAIHDRNNFPRGPNLFNVVKNKTQKTIQGFQNAQPSPPSVDTAHISAHNASEQPPSRAYIGEYLRKAWDVALNDSYDRAVKRAAKKGRKLPPKGEYYSHWGRKYFLYGPQSPPTYLSNTMYNGSNPASMVNPDAGVGWASCATGSCGQNDIAAGGCGGPGGCVQWSNRNPGTSAAYYAGGGFAVGGGCGGGGGGGG